MIKLFACDLDGTLLNVFHDPDAYILGVIREITDGGGHVAIATGRTMRTAYDHGFRGLPIELLGSSGTIVRDRNGALLKSFPIDPAALEEMLRAFPAVCFDCVAPDGTFVTGSRAEREASFGKANPVMRIIMRGMRGRRSTQDSMVFNTSVGQVLAHEICKINCHISDPGLNREFSLYLSEHTDTLLDAPFQPTMFEISDASANKATGVAWLAQYLGITEDEVAVYGDGGNDVMMLERFRHSYAPSNASDAAKEAAGTMLGHFATYSVSRHMRRTFRQEHSRIQIA